MSEFLVLSTGTYQRTLDAKGRVLLPKRMRLMLADCENLFLTPGTEQCIELHTSRSLEKLAVKASKSAPDSRTIQSFSRLFYAQAERIEIDPQGRIRIPARFTLRSGLEKEIAIIGVGFNWEIWQYDRWQEYHQSNSDDFDWVHQSTFDCRDTTQESPAKRVQAK